MERRHEDGWTCRPPARVERKRRRALRWSHSPTPLRAEFHSTSREIAVRDGRRFAHCERFLLAITNPPQFVVMEEPSFPAPRAAREPGPRRTREQSTTQRHRSHCNARPQKRERTRRSVRSSPRLAERKRRRRQGGTKSEGRPQAAPTPSVLSEGKEATTRARKRASSRGHAGSPEAPDPRETKEGPSSAGHPRPLQGPRQFPRRARKAVRGRFSHDSIEKIRL